MWVFCVFLSRNEAKVLRFCATAITSVKEITSGLWVIFSLKNRKSVKKRDPEV